MRSYVWSPYLVRLVSLKEEGEMLEPCFLCINAEEMPPCENKGTRTVYKLELSPESNPDDTLILDLFS